ncbi:MAG TPA: hypothetical protein VFW09_21570 [Solirubrobacteraceae bacterium]|nr:hypothetical protein [Solirubrobacteraceae bacterium]
MTTAADPVRAIADAVLYEGYILWPYRRSALKNQRRFTFGGVFPPTHSNAHPDDRCTVQTEVLVRGDGPVRVTVRFLHVVARTVLGPDDEPVDERVVDGERLVSWEEAVEREVAAPGPISVAAGSERDGCVMRSWEALSGRTEVGCAPAGAPGVRKLSVTVRNVTALPAGALRQQALTRTMCSTHVLLRAVPGDEFVSLTDPPPELATAAAGCRNEGLWPVLVGEAGTRDAMLASPIILEDHPRIAPESPGDLFDGGEIDQLLTLNVLALTDAERAEMAASDPRAREILERTEALTSEQLMALHGVGRVCS